MESNERVRRFWNAHGTSATHLVVLHAFSSNPHLQRTPEGLSLWYGLPVNRVRELCVELAECGILGRTRGQTNVYEWNPTLDWTDPRREPGSRIFMRRWFEESHAIKPADHVGATNRM